MAKRIGLIPLRDRVLELDRAYEMIEKEIAKELLSIDIGNYQEMKAVKAQEKIERLIEMLNRSVTKWAKIAIPEAYDKGHEMAETRLEILGAERNEEFPKKIHEQSVERGIEKTIDDLIRANLSIKLNAATYFYIVSQAAHRIMQIQEFDFRDEAFVSGLLDDAIIAGETRAYAKNTVLNHIKTEVGEGNFIRIRGRDYNMKKYADLVAKTRLRTVQTESVLNSCKEYDNDLVEVSSHGCDCVICELYEGGIFSLSGKSTTYSYLDSYPPWHPRCQHHIRPVSEEALKVRGRYEPTPGKTNFLENITDAEEAVVRSWSNKNYATVRKYLRAGKIEREKLVRQFGIKIKTDAETMQRLFVKYKDGVSEQMLYRGISNLSDEIYNTLKGYKPGDTAYVDKVISSWSTDTGIVDLYATSGNNVKFHLQANRTNTLELDISSFSVTPQEKEIILNTHKFRVIKIEEEIYRPIPSLPGETTLHIHLQELGPR